MTPLRRNMTVAMLAAAVIVAWSVDTPWTELKRHYATKESEPAGAVRWQRIVFVSAHHRGAYSIGGMTWALSEKSAFLALPAPLAWFSDGVRIPIAEIAGCRREVWSSGRRETQLWLRNAGVAIALPDQDGIAMKWCREHQVPVVTSKQLYEELLAQRGGV